MKTIRTFLTLGLLGALAALPALAADAKAKTYTLVGYYEGAEPAPDLVAKAAQAVGAKMSGMTQVQNPEDADHSVEILFKRGSFQVYVDALPVVQKQLKLRADHMLAETFVHQPDRGADARDGANGR